MIKRLLEQDELRNYIRKLKRIFINKQVLAIYIDDSVQWEDDNPLYEYDEKIGHRLYYDKKASEDVYLQIEDRVTFLIDGLFLHVEMCYSPKAREKRAFEIEVTKKNYDNKLNISHYYSKNTINRKIIDIYADEHLNIYFILDSGYEFIVSCWYRDYIFIRERLNVPSKNITYEAIKQYEYEKFSILNKYINEIKPKLIGNKIEKIMTLSEIFSEIYEDREFEFDDFIDIQIGSEHLNICFSEQSDVFVGINLFDYTETYYIYDHTWRSLNCIYKNNIIGQTVKDIVVTKYDNTHIEDEEIKKHFADKFISVEIHLENGYMFKITNSHDYTVTSEHLIEKTKN